MTFSLSTPKGRTRRRTALSLGTVALAVVAAVPAAVAGTGTPDTPQVAAPSVDMEMALLAAQVDPRKPNTGTTPGAKDHVLRVERALHAKGLLAKSAVDGHYGTSTITAYGKWLRRLGYRGCDANGIPGGTSLRKLGQGRFGVSRAISVGSRNDRYAGMRVNTRTKKMLAAADAKIGWGLRITQGSYHPGSGPSAGTHDCGGVVDISVRGLSTTRRWQTVKALRTVGLAAWLRTPSQGNWPYHIHAVAVSDPDLAPQAQSQVHDYYFDKNGLANHAKDNTPSKYRVKFTWWERYQRGS